MGSTWENLFVNVKGSKKLPTNYEKVEEMLKNDTPCSSIKAISDWYRDKYAVKYDKPMIGYNQFDCQKTIKNLAEHFNISIWEVCKLINKWFYDYKNLGYSELPGDSTLTTSRLKTSWIVNNLYNGIPATMKDIEKGFRLMGKKMIIDKDNIEELSEEEF